MNAAFARAGTVLVLLAAGACAAQVKRPALDDEVVRVQDDALMEESLRTAHARWARVLAVGFRLRTGAADLCVGHAAPILGLIGARRADLPHDTWELWERLYGTDDRVVVLHVLAGSPAAEGGVREGDRLVTLDGRTIRRYGALSEILRGFRDAPVQLIVARAGREIELDLPRVVACDSDADLALADDLGVVLQKNDEDLAVPTGLVRFVRSDDELAIALARETARSLIGDDADDDGERYPEADRLGLYLAANAGFDVSGAPQFWERIALEAPGSIECTEDVPGQCKPPAGRFPERSLVIQRTVREILDRQQRGEALVP